MLNFANLCLCGRENEKAALLHAYQRSTGSASQIVWIKGRSGTGKSALVEDVFAGQHEHNYVFCSGKFEQQQLPMPHSALATVLSKLWYTIECDYPNMQLHSEDLKILSNLVPEMCSSAKFDRKNGTVACNPEWELERLKQAVRSFIKAVCCNLCSPLIIFLDDLQWADLDTLSVVKDLLSDATISGLLFLGSYRDNEVLDCSSLTQCMNAINAGRTQCTLDVYIANLDHSAMCELVAGVLRVTPDQALPLSNLIHKKTEGNCFFALLMMQHIYDQGLIYKSSKTHDWEWNIEKIRVQVAVSDNVIDLLGQKLAALPPKTLNVLLISAFLGTRVNLGLLEMLLPLVESELDSTSMKTALDAAAQANLIEIDPDQSHFIFSHNRVVATVYAIIADENTRQLLHLRIGRFLHMCVVKDISITKNDGEDFCLFLAADQLNRGSKLIQEDEERVDLAKLNLRLSNRLVQRGAFQMSLATLKIAVNMLGVDRWEQHYDLTLDLNNSLAFVLLSNGKTEKCIDVIKEVRLNVKASEDSYAVHLIHIEALASTNRLDECLKVGLDVLNEVGYPKVPRKPSVICHIIPKVMAVKRLLKGMSDEDLLNLPALKSDDLTRRFILDVFASLIPVVFLASEMDLMPIFTCNLMEQAIRHGVTSNTAANFAGYGILLSIMGDFDGAKRFTELATRMMARFGAETKALFVVHSLLMHMKNPIQGSVGRTLEVYQMAFSKGDLRYVGQAAWFHIQIRLAAGLPLASLVEDGFAFCRQLQKYDQQVMFNLLLVALRAVVELMDLPSGISEFMEDEHDDATFEKNLNLGGATFTHLLNYWLYAMVARYYLGDLESALGFAKKLWKSKVLDQGTFANLIEYHLISALIAIHYWRSTRLRRYLGIFRKHHKILALWAKKGNVNTVHLVALLDVQVWVDQHRNFLDCTQVRRMYERAISVATRCGFVHHAALANELVGQFCLSLPSTDMYWARFYIANARDLYEDWNATAKVNQMELEYKDVLEPEVSGNKSVSSVPDNGSPSVSKNRRNTPLTGRSRVEVIVKTETTHNAASWNV